MTKDVLITMKGVQRMDGQEDETEILTRGNYYWKNGKHYLLFESQMSESMAPVKMKVKIAPGCLDILMSGEVSTHLVFQENQPHRANYVTPMGTIVIDMEASKVLLEESEDRICLEFDYTLDLNGSRMFTSSNILEAKSVGVRNV